MFDTVPEIPAYTSPFPYHYSKLSEKSYIFIIGSYSTGQITLPNHPASSSGTGSASAMASGDLLRVLPGETIPADGQIITGTTAVDQSIMTGESLPVDKTAGQSVFCGTFNGFGSIDIEATNVGEDSSLKKLIRMVREAEESKAPMQRIADIWTVWLVPIALIIAVAAFFILRLTGTELTAALNRAVTVLVVFCPCALALATPTAIIAAIGQAARHGESLNQAKH